MSAYYNEFDPFAAQWLRNLIAAGHIAPGDVDERSIEDVAPDDLARYDQCHFFAGIGVWSFALRRAGWPDDCPIWTGSCPCQPFSAAGKGAGFDDERHLWPAFHWLIEQRRPPVVVGEQVAGKDGAAWLDLVSADLEGTGYAFGAVISPAAGYGAPHIRHRTYWLADDFNNGRRQHWDGLGRTASSGQTETEERKRIRFNTADDSTTMRLGDDDDAGSQGHVGLADADSAGLRSSSLNALHDHEYYVEPRCDSGRPGPTNGVWRDADWLGCRDGKWRPVEPGTFPLAHGATNRVGRLRGYGNAIVAPQAQAFIEAYLAVI